MRQGRGSLSRSKVCLYRRGLDKLTLYIDSILISFRSIHTDTLDEVKFVSLYYSRDKSKMISVSRSRMRVSTLNKDMQRSRMFGESIKRT
jgi:hypothetical protein